MKRLTTVPQAELIKCCNCCERSNCYGDISCNEIEMALERLRKYENTGLEPEEIATVKSLAIQLLKKAIAENDMAIRIGKNKGINTTCIYESNIVLEKKTCKTILHIKRRIKQAKN